MSRPLLALLLLTALASRSFGADVPIPTPPAVDARSYLVVDYHTDKTLAALNPDARMEPASLTKLMTAYIVFQKLAAGALKLNEPVVVSEHAWRSEGSRTFIELGKPVTVEFLILGMVVQSGNDATIALAERIAGTEETFAQLMNSNAQRLGMTGTHFENSSGLPSPNHYTTAHDMALLAIALIRDFPQFYKYFSVREFEYNGIKQQNRNGLLEKDSTVDGLKTGHTDSAGFCLVTSSLRDGMRLVSVVLGSTSMKARENASAALLNYGFTFYDTKLVVHGGTKLASAPVWKAATTPVDVGIDKDLYITLPRSQSGDIKTSVDLQPRLIAPLARSADVGQLHVTRAGTVARDPPRASPGGGGSGRLVAPPHRHHQTLVHSPWCRLVPLPVCYLNGEYLPLAQARVSPLDRAFLFGDAVYEVVPVYAGRPFRLREHLDRLVRSLAGIRMEPPLTHAAWERDPPDPHRAQRRRRSIRLFPSHAGRGARPQSRLAGGARADPVRLRQHARARVGGLARARRRRHHGPGHRAGRGATSNRPRSLQIRS